MDYSPHGGGGGGGAAGPGGGGGPSSFPMSFHPPASSQARGAGSDFQPSRPIFGLQDESFDIFEWYPRFQSCLRYFLDHAQYNHPVQALAAFINIQLPCQKTRDPVLSSRSSGSPSAIPSPSVRTSASLPNVAAPNNLVTLTPYIRRLVVTGFDFPGVLHGFFGDDWVAGVGRLHEIERRNYLFAAKCGRWIEVKNHYDMDEGQTVPFLRALQNVTERELSNVESVHWSEWLSMMDWDLGPRAAFGQENDRVDLTVKQETPEESHSRYHDMG